MLHNLEFGAVIAAGLLCAACSPTPDPSPMQSGGGGAGGGGAPGPGVDVTVLVIDLSQNPEAGESVVVNGPSGAVVSQTQTAMDGKVGVHVPTGGMVLAYPNASGIANPTALGVVDPPDGSVITFLAYSNTLPNPETTLHLTLTGYPLGTATLGFSNCYNSLSVAADPSGKTIADLKNFGCGEIQSPKTNQVLAVAYDAQQNPLSWGSAENIVEVAGQSVPVPVAVNQQLFQVFSETIAPMPSGATSASVSMLSTLVAYPTDDQDLTGEAMPPGATASWSFNLPVSDLMSFDVIESVSSTSGSFQRTFSRTGVYKSLPPTLTFDPTTLATLDLNPVDASDSLHPKLSWTVGPGPQGDVIAISLSSSAPGGPGSGFTLLMAPESATSFRLPDVPAALVDYAPLPGSKWQGTVSLAQQEGNADWVGYLGLGTGSPTTQSAGVLPQ